MHEATRATDPARPETPTSAGWQPDPWGDGERYWDGVLWTRQLREAGSGRQAESDVSAVPVGPVVPVVPVAPTAERSGARDWELAHVPEDDRPFRSGLQRGMVWAFAVVAILAMLLTAISIWPLLLGGGGSGGGGGDTVIPVQSALSR